MVYTVQNKDDLDKQIADAGDKLVLIDFFASWCGPCKIISPKLEELATQYAEQAVVLKVNVDDCEDIALEYNVTSMPTFVFIKNNQIIDIFVGGNTDKLVKSMEKFIGDIALGFVEGNQLNDSDEAMTAGVAAAPEEQIPQPAPAQVSAEPAQPEEEQVQN